MTLVRPTQRWHSRLIQVPHVGPVYRPRTNGRTALEFEVPEAAVAYLLHHSFVQLVPTSEGEPAVIPPVARVASTIKQPEAVVLKQEDLVVPPEEEPPPEEPATSIPPVEDSSEMTPEADVEDLSEEPSVETVEAPVEPVETEEAEEAPVLDLSLEEICAFLSGKSRSQLMAIKGIGPKAAGEIVRAAPLTPEKLTEVLKENQLQSVIEAMRG